MCLFCDSDGQVDAEGQVLEERQGPLDLFQPVDPGHHHHTHPRHGCLVGSYIFAITNNNEATPIPRRYGMHPSSAVGPGSSLGKFFKLRFQILNGHCKIELKIQITHRKEEENK